MKKKNTPLLLAILDGLALNPEKTANAVIDANTPCLDNLLRYYPNTKLITHGPAVGLPEGQMGNSEVGHLTIGSGRVIEQDLSRINKTASNKEFDKIELFSNTINALEKHNSSLHLIGLSSTGGVHSELGHLISIVYSAAKSGLQSIIIHLITDGRDRPQKEAALELKVLEDELSKIKEEFPESSITIASLIGRYFAMDRDTRWDRTEKAYRLFTEGIGEEFSSISEALNNSYEKGIFDEFIEPVVFKQDRELNLSIKDGDAILFYNFRADRMRQIVSSFLNPNEEFMHFQKRQKPKLSALITLTEYDENFALQSSTCKILFPPIEIKNSFGEVLSKNNYSQLRIAETEKYPHVTYFFNGGNEVLFSGEERALIPSPRDVKTYDLKPEMGAFEITNKLLDILDKNCPDVIILNFANCDMVGHTGNFEATKKAVETVDSCLSKLLEKIKNIVGVAIVTADHGNADQMLDYNTKEAHTYHTTHPVPFIIYNYNSEHSIKLNSGTLADIAPTMLDILGLETPKEMSGKSLINC